MGEVLFKGNQWVIVQLSALLFLTDPEAKVDDSSSVHSNKDRASHLDLDPEPEQHIEREHFVALNLQRLSIAVTHTMYKESDREADLSFSQPEHQKYIYDVNMLQNIL